MKFASWHQPHLIGCEYPTPAASHRQNGSILTSSRINFDLDQTESRARHLYLTRLKDQMSLLSQIVLLRLFFVGLAKWILSALALVRY